MGTKVRGSNGFPAHVVRMNSSKIFKFRTLGTEEEISGSLQYFAKLK